MPKFHCVKRLCAYLLIIAAMLLSIGTVHAAITEESGRRVALVIGNSVYKTLPSLPNPANDVEEVATTLRAAGFDVTIGVNVDRIGLEDTVRRFLRSTSNAEAGLIYYSGHGIQVGGQNFIVPVDATLETPYDVETQTMPLDLILNHLKQNSRVQLIFLDACRNNPFNAQKFWMAEKLEPVGATRGLARIDSDLGSLIAFSTEPGQVALDGTGALSPYSESFIKRASEPNREIRQVLTDVRRDVIAMTDGKQVPWENSSLMDSFYFIPAPPPPSVEPMQQVSVPEGAATTRLPIAPPHDETGSALLVTLNQLPKIGKLSFDGKPVEHGAKMPAAALTALTYDSSGVAAGTVGLIGYTVSDPYGQATQGVIAITVSADAGAKLAQLEQEKQVRLADADAYLKELPRDVDTTIGVGPVEASLPVVPASTAEMTFKVAALPDKGTLRAGDRVIGLGHVLEAADIPALSYEPQIGTENQPFALTLQAANDDLPPATVTFKPVLNACDTSAAAPLDLQGVTSGKLPNEIDPDDALPACTDAIKAYPEVARFVYQLGRAQLANRETKTAFATIKKAMDAGHVRAIDQLSSLYIVGASVPANPAKANEIVQAGAKKNDPYALYTYGKSLFYGRGVKSDTQQGLKLMLQSADLGHTFAMNELGYIFLNGVNVPADPQRGIRFYEAGLARNDIYSMNNLALVYRSGKAVPQDLGKALELFTKAAEGGQPFAPTNLGRMYRDGIGVDADKAAAVKWLEMGAERGDYWGALDRARLAKNEVADPESMVIAARYFALAAAVNKPRIGDTKNQALAELKLLPSAAKKEAEKAFSAELTAQERTALPKTKSLDVKLVELARATWVKRNPRYDLF
ncbi:peptidase [Rhizobium laguerreae]|uniref:caspase family protein n=1 Tax=Rhizobium laguerreae TaxID=1076926 RepID=UPI001A8FFEEC|nr:caspase family protein [Rhizobium laguerreae]MBN9982959.1 caspase family protein [Rhizobium laguerreae]MBY3085777.1 peptidase [Rhizobium laguerreae]MBY3106477.1 peptidase [Rhizobium laguerreae]MBY3147898.1 peptidase [Rhizobium laguerreae]MBY3304819.1 peptidase [Rhizobium laguerreae]